MSEIITSRIVRTHDQTQLALHITLAKGAPKARVLIVHGYLEHARRYVPLCNALSDAGLESYAPDLRGHGHSQGARGHVLRFEDYFRDLVAVMDSAKADLPWLLVGHSLGGLIGLRLWRHLAEQSDASKKIHAAVLSNPYLAPSLHIPLYKRVLGHALSSVLPSLSLPAGITPPQLTSDVHEQKAAAQDPLITTRARARWFTESGRAQKEVLSYRRVPGPLWLILGEHDQVADHEVAKRWYEHLTLAPGSQLCVRARERHEVFKEQNRHALLPEVAAWLAARAGG